MAVIRLDNYRHRSACNSPVIRAGKASFAFLLLSRLTNNLRINKLDQSVTCVNYTNSAQNTNLNSSKLSNIHFQVIAGEILCFIGSADSGNVDILELKELLGHANVATTQIYTHLDQPRLRDAVNASPLSGLSFVPPPAPVKEETEEPEA